MNGGCITTFTGRRFDPLAPRPEDIDLADIAHALALTCRFKGHCRLFYSVAEHSVRVSRVAAAQGPELALWGLMHDAAEAYLADVAGPIKDRIYVHVAGRIETFADAEDRLLAAIAAALGFPAVDYERVRSSDLVLLATEARDVVGVDARQWGVAEAPLTEPISPWDWQTAQTAFLERFAELAPR